MPSRLPRARKQVVKSARQEEVIIEQAPNDAAVPLCRLVMLCRNSDAALELRMLAGVYRTVSDLTNALRLPLEGFARRFPSTENAPA